MPTAARPTMRPRRSARAPRRRPGKETVSIEPGCPRRVPLRQGDGAERRQVRPVWPDAVPQPTDRVPRPPAWPPGRRRPPQGGVGQEAEDEAGRGLVAAARWSSSTCSEQRLHPVQVAPEGRRQPEGVERVGLTPPIAALSRASANACPASVSARSRSPSTAAKIEADWRASIRNAASTPSPRRAPHPASGASSRGSPSPMPLTAGQRAGQPQHHRRVAPIQTPRPPRRAGSAIPAPAGAAIAPPPVPPRAARRPRPGSCTRPCADPGSPPPHHSRPGVPVRTRGPSPASGSAGNPPRPRRPSSCRSRLLATSAAIPVQDVAVPGPPARPRPPRPPPACSRRRRPPAAGKRSAPPARSRS